MRVFISDLHLGDGSRTDDFSHDGHFIEFDKAVENHMNKGARIVIFGHTYKAQLQNFNKGIYTNCRTRVDGGLPTYIAHQEKCIEFREGLTHKAIKKIVSNQD